MLGNSLTRSRAWSVITVVEVVGFDSIFLVVKIMPSFLVRLNDIILYLCNFFIYHVSSLYFSLPLEVHHLFAA